LDISPAPLEPLDSILGNPFLSFQIAGALDLAGLLVAIWTLWSTISLTLGGKLLRAFRLISMGALAFALSHLLDSLLQATKILSLEPATFLHQGIVVIAMFLFVMGLAGLTDDLPGMNAPRYGGMSLRLWPMAVGLALGIGALSFIVYGFDLIAETWAFIWLGISLVLLLVICLILVLRARLGGAIGHSLWLAMLGLFIFGMGHPVQIWFYLNTTYAPGTLAVLHRLVVIPAFFLFAISITRLGRHLDRANRAQMLSGQTSQIGPLSGMSAAGSAQRHRLYPQ
jgi:hypothetical protein